jgi:hypothetical protein
MAIPRWHYRFSRPAEREIVSVTEMLRDFHRAHLLGMEVEELRIDGVPVGKETLNLLQLWVEASGASNAARQDYFEAWRRLDRVLFDPAPYRARRRGRK